MLNMDNLIYACFILFLKFVFEAFASKLIEDLPPNVKYVVLLAVVIGLCFAFSSA